MDTPNKIKKVHDTYPDPDPEEEACEHLEQSQTPSWQGAVNFARPRPMRIPRPDSPSYPAYKAKKETAMRINIHRDFESELARLGLGVTHLEMTDHELIMHINASQSKLSQQELAELQKATHFDKKELQQWYKGMLYTTLTRQDHTCQRTN